MRVPTYLSHSYRAADRELNERICTFFWEQGFAFTVDPKSGTPTISHLEVMMKRSAAFVAIAPLRSDVEYHHTSPFIVYECGLAEQRDLPSLVLLETGVSSSAFDTADIVPFDRRTIEDTLARELPRIRELHERGRPDAAAGVRALGTVGLLLPPGKAYRRALPRIIDVLERAGYRTEVVDAKYGNPWRRLIDLRGYDFVVTDIAARQPTGQLFPLLYGAFIPSIKLVHDTGKGQPVPIAPMALGEALTTAGVVDDVALRWATEEDLVARLSAQVSKLQGPRTQFHSLDESLKYFRSLDRRSSGPVFVSNAGEDNELARRVTRLLELYNIEVFHYVYRNSIERGVDFAGPLRNAVTSSSIFIPLLSEHYWRSPWCHEEFKLASLMGRAGRLTVVPYFLDATESPDVSMQGETIIELDTDERAAKIVSDVDDLLTRGPAGADAPRSAPTVDELRDTVDVAVVTVLTEEYREVRQRLRAPVSVQPSRDQPNRHAWDFGEVTATHRREPYRVVLGLAGGPGTSAGLQAVTDTVRTFRPRYVLLVGIAGGLSDVRLGDVVVSDTIVGYEYGKVDGGSFAPRTDWTYRTDTAMITGARTADARFPDWHGNLADLHGRTTSPHVVVGPVASGNKVVDDVTAEAFGPVMRKWPKLVAVEMEGLGAAEAVHALREEGLAVNFAMIRGISDLPTRSAAADAEGPPGSAGQTAQRDDTKPLAAAAAAEYAVHLLREAWPILPLAEEAGR